MRGKVKALSKGSKVIKNNFGSHSRIKEQGQANFYITLWHNKREQSCKIASELKILFLMSILTLTRELIRQLRSALYSIFITVIYA